MVLPFFMIDDLSSALYLSNFLGIILLFIVGYFRSLGKGWRAKLTTAILSAMVGIIITAITVVLGG